MGLRISLLYWFMGAVTAIMLFVSVLLHEKEGWPIRIVET